MLVCGNLKKNRELYIVSCVRNYKVRKVQRVMHELEYDDYVDETLILIVLNVNREISCKFDSNIDIFHFLRFDLFFLFVFCNNFNCKIEI